MSIVKPYFRIWRPVKGYSPWGDGFRKQQSFATIDYLRDGVFACQEEMQSSVTTTHLIIRDLYEVFNYIEPNDDNLQTYSHRIYELFLRTATEFESNCKGILKANGYAKEENRMNIKEDYFKIAQAARLSEYSVNFERWTSARIFQPFAAWNTTNYASLPWYQGYNKVKHDRYANFREANMSNLMNAIAGLLCIMHAQYGEEMQSACFERIPLIQDSQDRVETNTFTITAPNFLEEEKYNFIWEVIKKESEPVQCYHF